MKYLPESLGFVPLRDLFGFAVWIGGAFGKTIYWRDRKLTLRPDGKVSVCKG